MILAWTAVAAAQQTPDFATIRKTELGEIDRNNVEAWVSQQIQQLLTAQDNDSIEAQGATFFQTVKTSTTASDATERFKSAFADMLVAAFGKEYAKPADNRKPLGVVYALMAVNQVARPNQVSLDALTRALKDPAAGVRLMAATGLAGIRDQLSEQQWAALLVAVRPVSVAETDAVAALGLYRLLAAPAGPKAEAVMPVVLDTLEARLGAMEQKNLWPALADAEIIRWIGGKVPAMTDAQRQTRDRAILLLGRLMSDAVHAYTTRKPDDIRQETLEKVVMASEAQLKAIAARLSPSARPPDLTAAMLEGGANQAAQMKLALNKWIGTPQDAGVLNGAPYNLPRELGIKRPVATTQTAPAEG